MSYLTAKEQRVQKEWNKRGIAGLRSKLLQTVGERALRGWDNEQFVRTVAVVVYSAMPEREWGIGGDSANKIIGETLGLAGIDMGAWLGLVTEVRLMEEQLREAIGDE
jgi:hypothetical protein